MRALDRHASLWRSANWPGVLVRAQWVIHRVTPCVPTSAADVQVVMVFAITPTFVRGHSKADRESPAVRRGEEVKNGNDE